MRRGSGLSHDPARAAERRARREQRRAAEAPRRETVSRAGARDDGASRRAWQETVTAAGCVMCKAFPVDAATARERRMDLAIIDPHHIVPQQDLKRWGLHVLLCDPRNGIALCRLHHARHELAYQRVPRSLLPAAAFAFAREINAVFVLEDDAVYPVTEAAETC